MMKKFILLGIFTLGFVLPVAAGAFLEYFNVNGQDDNIVLTWKTRTESGVEGFEVQRKSGSNGSFIYLDTVNPKGSNSSYTYTDRSVYKEATGSYTYRLKILDNSGQPGYSQEVEITPNISSVKRTWGSIKAMFR